MSDKERAKELFIKGTAYYQDRNFAEALKYFQASDRIRSTETTTFYLESCKKRMNASGGKPNGSSAGTSTNGNCNGTSSSTEDIECDKILKTKDYYDILKVTKESPIQDIKKAYKKLAIKFHPDKNHSSKAEEAFKKIAAAYQTLSDPEKKAMYDKYGTEEEYREKYYQAHQQQYEEEIDPFDLLNMFFNGGFNGGARFQRRYHPQYRAQRYEQHYQDNDNQRQNPQNLLPIVLIFGGYIISSIFTSVPLYQFHQNYDYSIKKRTSLNKIDYFVGSSFSDTYPTLKSVKESGIEITIERDYLNVVKDKCQDMMRYKNDLEAQLSYYRYNQYYRNQINSQIKRINYEYCYKYQDLAKKIRG